MGVYFLLAFLTFLPCIQGSDDPALHPGVITVSLLGATFCVFICFCMFYDRCKKHYRKRREQRRQINSHIEQSPSSEVVETDFRQPFHRQTERCHPLYIEASGKRIIRHVPKSIGPSVSFSRVVATRTPDVAAVSTTPARSSTAPTVNESMPRHTAVSTRGTISPRAQVVSSTSSLSHGNLSNQSAYVSTPSEQQASDGSNTRSPVISTISSPQRHGLIDSQYSAMPTISAPPAYANISRRDSSISMISAPPPYDSTCMTVQSPTISSSISSLPAYDDVNSLAPHISGSTSPPAYETVNTQNPDISTISAPPPPYEYMDI